MNSINQREPGLLRWIPWMAGLAVIVLMFVLEYAGALPGAKEHLIEVTLPQEVPGLRSRLRPGSVSADGLKVVLAGSALRDDSGAVVDGFRKLLKELGADPQSIATHGSLPVAERAQSLLVQRWMPWMGLAVGVGALCHLWIRLGTVSRVLVEREHLEGLEQRLVDRMQTRNEVVNSRCASLEQQHGGVRAELAGLRTEVTGWMGAVETRLASVAGQVAGAGVRIQAAEEALKDFQKTVTSHDTRLSEVKGLVASCRQSIAELRGAIDSIGNSGSDPRVDPLQQAMKEVDRRLSVAEKGLVVLTTTQERLGTDQDDARKRLEAVEGWREDVAPHVEAFGKESTQLIEARQRHRDRVEKVITGTRPVIGPPPGGSPLAWDRLARELGVDSMRWDEDEPQKTAIEDVVKKLATGSEAAVILEGPTGVGKDAILKALPALVGYPAESSPRFLTPNGGWFPDAMEGYEEGVAYHPGILPSAILDVFESEGTCPWVIINELGELPHPFPEVFSSLKDTVFNKQASERTVCLFRHTTEKDPKILKLPAHFRIVMARNPALREGSDHGEFASNGAWSGRVEVMRIPPLRGTSESRLLRSWIDWSAQVRRRDGRGNRTQPFFGQWNPLPQPPGLDDGWLDRLCTVMEASRFPGSEGRKDGGWRYVETGTGETRSLIRHAATQSDHKAFLRALESKLIEKVVRPVRDHVMDSTELELFRKTLEEQGFRQAAGDLQTS